MRTQKEINFSEGPILKNIVLYSLPIIALSLVQTLYGIIGTTILSFFASDDAVAAVGAPGGVTSLITSFVIGLSVGTNVMLARCVGAKNEKQARQYVGTSIYISLVCGFAVAAIIIALSRTFLVMTKCDPGIMDMALLHMRVSALATPISMLQMFSAAVMRSTGDTIRPMKYSLISGFLNILFNLFFNGVLHLGVLSVSLSSMLSCICATVPCVLAIVKTDGYGKLERKHIKFYPRAALNIARNGIPVGVQTCLFTISSVMMQTSVNSFGKQATAANTFALNYTNITYAILAAFAQAMLIFVSQNYGAARSDRIKKAIPKCMALSVGVTLAMGIFLNVARKPLSLFLTQDEQIIEYMAANFLVFGGLQFINAIMEILNNAIKGLGRPMTAMIAALTGNLVVIFVWLKTVFVAFPRLDVVYMAYPAAWIVSTIIFAILYLVVWKRAENEMRSGKILE